MWYSYKIYLLFCSLALIGCSTLSDEEVTPEFTLTDLEQRVFGIVNEYRDSLGVYPLTLEGVIFEQARKHATAIAEGEITYSHQGFNERLSEIRKEIPFGIAGENLGYNSSDLPIEDILNQWLLNDEHRNNMENAQYSHAGVGVAQNSNGIYFITQIFIEKKGE